jgi:hypothetical protein
MTQETKMMEDREREREKREGYPLEVPDLDGALSFVLVLVE